MVFILPIVSKRNIMPETEPFAYTKLKAKPEGPPDTSPLEKLDGAHHLFNKEWLTNMSKRPLYLDIGTGMGRFLMYEAEKNPQNAYLGIDPDYQCIKKNLQKLCNRAKKGVKIDHVSIFYGSVYYLLPQLPEKSIDTVYISYPDPWFKRRHLKRRLVKEELFSALKPLLKNGASVFVQTDIEDYAKFIDREFENLTGFEIQFEAHSLFEEFTTTLYQEKALSKKHSRFCYHLKNIEI
jgi:tRNA (guanine-N(7)-)-methyltransferase